MVVITGGADEAPAAATLSVPDQFGEDLNRMLSVKNLGELKWYSGYFYERDREAGRLKISQQTYTEVGTEV